MWYYLRVQVISVQISKLKTAKMFFSGEFDLQLLWGTQFFLRLVNLSGTVTNYGPLVQQPGCFYPSLLPLSSPSLSPSLLSLLARPGASVQMCVLFGACCSLQQIILLVDGKHISSGTSSVGLIRFRRMTSSLISSYWFKEKDRKVSLFINSV